MNMMYQKYTNKWNSWWQWRWPWVKYSQGGRLARAACQPYPHRHCLSLATPTPSMCCIHPVFHVVNSLPVPERIWSGKQVHPPPHQRELEANNIWDGVYFWIGQASGLGNWVLGKLKGLLGMRRNPGFEECDINGHCDWSSSIVTTMVATCRIVGNSTLPSRGNVHAVTIPWFTGSQGLMRSLERGGGCKGELPKFQYFWLCNYVWSSAKKFANEVNNHPLINPVRRILVYPYPCHSRFHVCELAICHPISILHMFSTYYFQYFYISYPHLTLFCDPLLVAHGTIFLM